MPFNLAWLIIPGVIVIAVVAIVVIVMVFNRDLTSGGPRPTTGGGGMFGGVAEIFDPGAHRAQLEKDRLKHQAAIIPRADPGDKGRSRVIIDKRGNPVGFVAGKNVTTTQPADKLSAKMSAEASPDVVESAPDQ